MNAGSVPALLHDLIRGARARHPDRPALIGVAGAQGAGKTHACALLEAAKRLRIARFSLDDVYWSKSERSDLARLLHPLFVTRGPPGTHDLDLARKTIASLQNAGPEHVTPLPRFDKFRDEPEAASAWPLFRGRPEAIVVDGWCLGASLPKEGRPLNAVEAIDSDGAWRKAQSIFLAEDYARFFQAFDAIVYLQAPNWEIVKLWRAQQEEQTLGRPLTDAEAAALERFTQHFERITRSMMAGGHSACAIAHLDEARSVVRVEQRNRC